MKFDADDAGLGRILAIFTIAALLTGCGSSGDSGSGDSANAVTSASGSSSSTNGASSAPTASVALSASEYTVAPASTAVMTIYRSGSSAGTATVGYSTVNGTATAGTDYVATSGTVTWSDGDSTAKSVTVPVSNTASGKRFALALTSVEGDADFGTPAAATVQVSTSAMVPSGSSSSGATSGSNSGASSSSSSSGGSGSSGSAATPTTGAVTLSWAAPTENTNGSALTNLSGYVINYGTSTTAMTQTISINTVGTLSYVIGGLSSGTWYFEVVSVNASGVQSNPSSVVSTTI